MKSRGDQAWVATSPVSNFCNVSNPCNNKESRAPFINVAINNIVCDALIDSGASVSVISSSLAKKMCLKVEEAPNFPLRAVGGTRISICASANVSIDIRGYFYQVGLLVVLDSTDLLILGQDFLTKYGAIVDFATSVLSLQNSVNIPFNSTSDVMQRKRNCSIQPVMESINGSILKSSEYLYFVNLVENNEKYLFAAAEEKNIEFNVNNSLPGDFKRELNNMLIDFRDTFSFSAGELGCYRDTLINLKTTDEEPVHKVPYRVSPKQREIIEEQVKEMLKYGIIQESSSSYASPVVLVDKPEGPPRFCIDYRALNKKIRSDSYPIPRVDDLLSCLQGAQYFADLDMNSGYWQLAMGEGKEKTAFVTHTGLYEFNVLPFGLKISQAVFQRALDKVLAGMKYRNVIVYVDNILVFGATFQEFLGALKEVLTRFRDANLTLKPSKCRFGYQKVTVLGHEVSAEGIGPDVKKVEAIRKMSPPRNVKEVRAVVGLFSYYRKFIDNFARMALPLTSLLKKDKKFVWSEDEQAAFEELRSRICSAPILGYYSANEDLTTRLFVDSSGYAIGCCLMQGKEELKPIAYASRKLSEAEQKYSVTEKECLALIWALNYFKSYLWGLHFQVITDHRALVWLKSKRDMNGRLARWALSVQDWNFDIVYCKGKDNVVADFLSRNPLLEQPDGKLERVPEQEDGLQLYAISLVDFQAQQEADEFCNALINRLRNGEIRNYRGFILQEGILYKQSRVQQAIVNLLVVPNSLFAECMRELHDCPWSGGHFGLFKTYARFKLRYFMVGAEKKVEAYVKSCQQCQERNLKKIIAPLVSIPVENIFDRIGIDVLGPFRSSIRGNKFILVAVEYLSKYLVCKAVPRVTAEVVEEFLVSDIFCRFGGIKEVLADRGTVFTARLVHETVRNFGARMVHTTSLNPKCNGLTENANRILLNMLAKYIEERQSVWCSILPLVCFAYNSSKHRSTGVSPYMVLHGREPLCASDIELGINCINVAETIREKCRRQSALVEVVKQRIRRAQASQKTYYDKRARAVTFQPGELVMLFCPKRLSNKCIKLCRLFKGPYRVIRRVGSVNYVVRRLGIRRTGPQDLVNVNRLKKFFSREG